MNLMISKTDDNLKCPVCNDTLADEHCLTLHLRKHNDDKDNFLCKICNKILGSQASLDRHVLIHSGERPYICTICGLTFTTSGNMNRHLRQHHSYNNMIVSNSTLNNNNKIENEESATLNDNKTESEESSTSSADEAAGYKRTKRRPEANNNDVSFDLSSSSKRHKKVNSKSSSSSSTSSTFLTADRQYSCPQCEHNFISLQLLENHLQEEHPEYAAQCNECCLEFKNFRVLNLHRFMVHLKYESVPTDPYLVDFSSRKFPLIAKTMKTGRYSPLKQIDANSKSDDFFEKLDLKKSPAKKEEEEEDEDDIDPENDIEEEEEEIHVEDEEGQKENSAKSEEDYIDEDDNTDEDLVDVKTLVANAKNYGLSMTTPDVMLRLPVTPPDSGSRNFIEEEQDCFAAEFRKMKMRGEFPCRLCTAVFPNLRALKGHNRVHLSSSTNNFQCNMCPYYSTDKSAVIRHLRTHNGDRPYECALCNFAFTTKANCERHLRNRHCTSKCDVRRSIIYHPSEDPTITPPKDEVKRSLFIEDDEKREVGTMTNTLHSMVVDSMDSMDHSDNDAPLDLTCDALDLSTKNKRVDDEYSSQKIDDSNLKAIHSNLPASILSRPVVPPPAAYPSFFPPHPQSNFYPSLPPPPSTPQFFFPELKERLQEELLLRGLRFNGGSMVINGHKNPEPIQNGIENTPVKVEQNNHPPSAVKMVIKNGVLVPKQKQRRYRTERPFGCEHCSARFTLRSNMERHVKQQHPQLWQATRGPTSRNRTSKQVKSEDRDRVKQVLAEQIKSRPSKSPPGLLPISRLTSSVSLTSPSNHAHESEDGGKDLASVSTLLESASSQTFKQYFDKEDDEDEEEEEEGLVASASSEGNNSASDGNKSEGDSETSIKPVVAVEKKKSAYSLAPNRVSCPYCSRTFPWTSSLRRHVLTHTGQKPYKCPKCPLLFTTKSNCDRHLARKHGGGQATLVLEEIETKIPVEDDEKVIKSPKCNEEEEKVGNLTQETFKCHLCESVPGFQERQSCLDHLREKHEAEYRSLVAKGALDSNSADDEDENEDETSTTLKQQNHNNNNVRNSNADYTNRKVRCALCLRRFWSAEDLRRHMRTHTGERPFSCSICRRKFTLKHSMLRHRKKHNEVLDNTNADLTKVTPSHVDNNAVDNNNTGDLISNLLGLSDRSIVDRIIDEKSAASAAKLLQIDT